jgi:hypothetical protein
MFGGDKLPELWISVLVPSLRENTLQKGSSSRSSSAIHFHEVWRAGKVTPRLNEETIKSLPEQNGKVISPLFFSTSPTFVSRSP